MNKAGTRHLTYYALLDALKLAKGCPLCELEAESVRHYLDGVLYESVNDPRLRQDLRRSGGFCRRHAEALLSFANGHGTAILYQDQVRLFLQCLDELRGSRRKIVDKGQLEWLQHVSCPACRIESDAGKRYIDALIAGLAHDEMRAALEDCPGLCVPHCLAALDSARNTEAREHLLNVEHRNLESLLSELREFRRKHDYRFSHEEYGAESDSWRRAVRLIAGGG